MTRRILALAPVVAIALAGCSTGSGTTTSPTPVPTSSTSSTPSPSQTHSAKPSKPPATEFNPPGDIPDNQVFVDYRVPGTTVHIKVPEGWPRSKSGGTVTFTDHYNSIAVSVVAATSAPTVKSARQSEVPQLEHSVSNYAAGDVTTVQRQHGNAVLVTYLLDSSPDKVTGKVVRDAAERYEFWHAGQEAVLTLTGPKGADNVDPWRTVSDSLTWQ
jgi:hypothetical protein